MLKSNKLDNVCYDIRGEALELAKRLENKGHRIFKLNTGNTYPFGLNAPEEIVLDVIKNIDLGQGYIDSKGLFSARKAIMQECQKLGINRVDTEDIYMGNGVSELIVTTMQALLNEGDEVLIPSPDYPLWTAATILAGGRAVHYVCDEQAAWFPDIADIEAKITSRTKALLVINPNNPTGSVYPLEILEALLDLARRNKLLLLSDEIYQKITYDNLQAPAIASLADDLFIITYNGLSKSYRLPGFRVGWMILSGRREHAKDFIAGLDMLCSMRLCSNVPAQFAVQTALGGYQSIYDLTAADGRLRKQRDLAYSMINDIPGLSVVKPGGAIYLFPKLSSSFKISDDMQFVKDLLLAKHILIVQGTGFNIQDKMHFRLVFLPALDNLKGAIQSMASFLADYRQVD